MSNTTSNISNNVQKIFDKGNITNMSDLVKQSKAAASTKRRDERNAHLGRLEDNDYRGLMRNPKYDISEVRLNMRRLNGAEYIALAHRPRRHNYYAEHPEAVETVLAGPVEECLAKEYMVQCSIFDNATPPAVADTDTTASVAVPVKE